MRLIFALILLASPAAADTCETLAKGYGNKLAEFYKEARFAASYAQLAELARDGTEEKDKASNLSALQSAKLAVIRDELADLQERMERCPTP